MATNAGHIAEYYIFMKYTKDVCICENVYSILFTRFWSVKSVIMDTKNQHKVWYPMLYPNAGKYIYLVSCIFFNNTMAIIWNVL